MSINMMQPPKPTSAAQKAAKILAWIQRSGTAHSIKDLEKILPAVASIPSMQVKDHLVALVDDDKVRVEKIGSGNWYWSFPSDEKQHREEELKKLNDEKDQLNKQLENLSAMVKDRESQLDHTGGRTSNNGQAKSRKELVETNDALGVAVKELKMSLGEFSGIDPDEVAAKWRTVGELRDKTETWTDQIQCMEGYIGERCGDKEEVMFTLHQQFYGEEADCETGQLKEWSEDAPTLSNASIPTKFLTSQPENHRNPQIDYDLRVRSLSLYSKTLTNLRFSNPSELSTTPAEVIMSSTGDRPPLSSQAGSQNPPSTTQGRGRGRGGNAPRGERGTRSPYRGRGRGGRRGGSNLDRSAPQTKPNVEQLSNAVSGLSTQEGARVEKPADATEDEGDAETCFICTSVVIHYSVAPCNHRTCHICSLRLRALYKTNACAHCRTAAEYVIFTDDSEKKFEDFKATDFSNVDGNLGIKFEKREIFEDTVLLLRYNCPDPTCDVACSGWPELHRHVRNVHHKTLCDLCTRHKKVFTHEHTLFNRASLQKHERHGDDNPGDLEQSGFRGHPECGFCRMRFYDDDELYTHCRDKHERCHICDRRNQGTNTRQQYYQNYTELELHFRKQHFLCPDRECLEKKFVVFESELDIKGHQLEAHPDGLSKDARRDAQRVDISSFAYSDFQPPQRGHRQGGGRGRGRDPNADALPPSSAQPLRRDEMAYHRQLAIQGAQNEVSRTFGGALTASPGPAFAASAGSSDAPTTVSVRPSAGRIQRPPTEAPAPPAIDSRNPPSPRTAARSLRHNALIGRVARLLSDPESGLTTFQSLIASFKSGAISGSDLITGIFDLTSSASRSEVGKVINELVDIFEIEPKKQELRSAWNDWKAMHEDYPSLPVMSEPGSSRPLPSSTWAGAGSGRVLKLKSSTARSARRAGVADTFPTLSAASKKTKNARPTNTPWVSLPTPSPAAPSTSRPTRDVPAIIRSPKPTGGDSFPALPPAAKPVSSVFSPGYRGNAVLRAPGNANGASSNAWGSRGNENNTQAAQGSLDGMGAEGDAGGKARKGKKVLMKFG
ncbi:hypothetical protein P152DRAFT_471303 [Eremomyces bilateralis CBS 781.70]|uniref:RING-type E3 ubiquitin transferase n=1 Tax=Eremomyces bilateralis CBS 781.70 TaxID=1392243 RepID=A0A6G1GDE5_9PEZI|nr:uncharacterized protein P152DRAFT_471303 [Eremomyces bilateralis CBS 781.70]KAF1815930.1 hypothetical protein P152DRAFT_471303 [Eremomyces bilateralis CBS 781.70]